MNIYAFKKHFESLIQPAPERALVRAELAWQYFQEVLEIRPVDSQCEEVSFSVSVSAHWDGRRVQTDPHQFQIYFNRLMDAQPGQPWRMVDMRFYYRYPMSAELRAYLAAVEQPDRETWYCNAEDAAAIQRKLQPVCALARGPQAPWEWVRALAALTASYEFWLE